MEDAREEVENRYIIPKRSYKRARREEESALPFRIDENEDDLVGLAFIEE
jgi:DNA-directed RNA polymerase subunit K/omega